MAKMIKMSDCGLCVELLCSVGEQYDFFEFFDSLPMGSFVLSSNRVSEDNVSVRVYCSSEYIRNLEKFFVERGVIDG